MSWRAAEVQRLEATPAWCCEMMRGAGRPCSGIMWHCMIAMGAAPKAAVQLDEADTAARRQQPSAGATRDELGGFPGSRALQGGETGGPTLLKIILGVTPSLPSAAAATIFVPLHFLHSASTTRCRPRTSPALPYRLPQSIGHAAASCVQLTRQKVVPLVDPCQSSRCTSSCWPDRKSAAAN